jgi:[acyl-carrier-protein] S-malonyltransferase
MQAIVGLDKADVEAVAELARAHGVVVVANHNTPQQVVITGEAEAVAAAGKLAKARAQSSMPLPCPCLAQPADGNAPADFAQF